MYIVLVYFRESIRGAELVVKYRGLFIFRERESILSPERVCFDLPTTNSVCE